MDMSTVDIRPSKAFHDRLAELLLYWRCGDTANVGNMNFWEKDVSQIVAWMDELLEGDNGTKTELIQQYHYIEASLIFLKHQQERLQQELES